MKNLIQKSLFISLIVFLWAAPAWSEVIRKIEIRGYKRIQRSTIQRKIRSSAKKSLNRIQVRKDIAALYATGFFSDVVVRTRKVSGGVNLIYIVTEKPSVSGVKFVGNDEIDDDELKDAADLNTYQSLNQSKIRDALIKIRKLYESKGYFLADATHTIKRDRRTGAATVVFKISENSKISIKSIEILGNRKIDSKKLKAVMVTKESGVLDFFSPGAYQRDAFERDLQVIKLYYLNKGYIRAKITDSSLQITPDKKSMHIVIRLEEGPRYRVGRIRVSGDLLYSKKEIIKRLSLKKGSIFSYDSVRSDLEVIQEMYGDKGYAFVNPAPETQVNDEKLTVNINFKISKGYKVHIGRISMAGNIKTRDKVIRRELKIIESELYSDAAKRESTSRVRRLGFFEEVNILTKPSSSNRKVVNVTVQVKERRTGSLHIQGGYGSFQGLILGGQMNQSNFLGRGQSLSASLNWSKEEQLFNINFSDPYFLDTKWGFGTDLYRSKRSRIEYDEIKFGGGFRLGYPLAPYLRGIVGYELDNTQLTLSEDGDKDLFKLETANGVTNAVSASIVYDRRDDRMFPSNGLYARVHLEKAGLGGDIQYTRSSTNLRFYKKLFWNIVWRNNLTYGKIVSDDGEPPFNQLYLLGGANSLRGFRWFSIGKRVFSQKVYSSCLVDFGSEGECRNRAMVPFGGTQQLYFQTELQMPIVKETGLHGLVFFDIGEAQDKLDIKQLRANVGFGFRWFSPIGPLRFEWGFPLNRRPELGESGSEFQFTIGAPF